MNLTITQSPNTPTQQATHLAGSNTTLNTNIKINRDTTSIDITENEVMDNEPYKGHGLTADDIMQQAANIDVSTQKNFMVVMSNCVSGEDYEKMAKDGFTPGSCDPETYVTILDKIKATLASAGVDIEGFTDTLDTETLEEITGAITQALQIKNMSSDTVKYLVENEKIPTIDNLYKADYSTTDTLIQTQGYYSDGAYYAKKADEINIENLMPALDQAVTNAGFKPEQREGALETAKWLVESGIELNTDNLINAYNIQSIELPLDKDKVTNLCINAVINGKSPYEANLAGEMTIDEQSKDLIETVNNITDDQIHEAINRGIDLNIRNIANIVPESENGNETTQSSLKEIEAKRQMEEIRLMMTNEANRHLIRQGISIDTTKLSKLVDLLKESEAQIKETLYKGQSTELNDEMDQLYNETLTKTDELADMPAALLGPLASKIGTYTIENLYQSGLEQTSIIDKIDEYEKLMTAPRYDLGDSIKKAFRNVDDILTDMGLETSDSNRRAVRILGYNSMEIDSDTIETVKLADQEVNSVISRMTPATVLKMIREQKNPLNMSMDELDDYLNKNNDSSLESSEKYSKFLRKLDQSSDITSDEREAYIGIYRLFNQIEKSDGAVIGSIVASGAQMNFKNMLLAVRTNQHKNMDITIDDGFGALSELITGTKAIDAQINQGFDATADNDSDTRNKEKYYSLLSGEINSELSDKTDLSKLKDTSITADTTIEGFKDKLYGIRIDQQSTQNEQNAQYEAYKESINQAVKASDKMIEGLLDYSQPVTTNNLEAALLLNTNKNDLFGKLRVMSDDVSDDIIDEGDSFIEGLSNDKENVYDLYTEIIKSAKQTLDDYVYNPDTTYIDIKAAQGMYKELSLMGGLAREENYQIPMNIDGEVTNVNLKIYHNKSQKGEVAVTLENNIIGKVAAQFLVDDDKITGMVACENDYAKEQLEDFPDALSEAFGNKKVNISVVRSQSIELEKFGDDRDKDSKSVSTRELYDTAKVFLKSINSIGGEHYEN
jgi:hypothetical protein